MYYFLGVFVAFLVISVSTANNDTQNSIGFPEIEEDLSQKNKDNRQPVFMPSTCPENELYYPGDQADDWICDCRPANLYHPASDSCWPAYRRGPCAIGEYLILPKDSVIPICVQNPCKVDSYVMFNKSCQRLGSITSCSYLYPIVAAVGVNAASLDIDCEVLNLESRFGDDNALAPAKDKCKRGSKLSVNGKCEKVYK